MKILFTLTFLISSMAFSAPKGYSEYGFKLMDSAALNRNLENALKNMDCKVSQSSGVGAFSAEHHARNPKSCHEIGRAIDIFSLSCKNGGKNEDNLQTLFNKLSGFTYSLGTALVCYKKQGFCTEGDHSHHLHYGNAQWTGCFG